MSVRFSDFTVDLERLELRRGSDIVPIEQKNFDLLALLIENRHRVLTKDEIFTAIWPNVFVTDASLSTAISQVRKALGDTGEKQTHIKTIRGRGFRFVTDIRGDDLPVTAREELRAPDGQDTKVLPSNRPIIAVFRFDERGPGSTHSAIAEAIPAELIATLSRLRWIKVIARGSSFKLPPDQREPEQVRRTLRAEYMLSGTIERLGQQFSISVELTDTRSAEVVWAETFTCRIDDVFATRERIARQVVSAMELRVPLHEANLLSHTPSEDLTAWGHYHLGVRHMQTYSRKNNAIAERHFAQAIMLDPDFARAHAALSYTEFQNHFQMYGQDTDLHRRQALAHAEAAIDLDPLDPFCNLNIGRAKWLFDEVEQGLGWMERALQSNPNYAFGFYNSAMLRSVLCDGETAEAQVKEALDLSPLDPHLQSMLGIRTLAALLRGEDDDAVAYAEQTLRAPNPHLYVYMIVAIIFLQAGQMAKAKACLEKIRARNSAFSSKEFLSHYNLRDPEQKAVLVRAVEQLGI